MPVLVNLTSYSLHLKLPMAHFTDCEDANISMATLKYYVYYGTVNENSVFECTKTSLYKCTNVTTSRNLLQINDLDPYVMYTVFVYVTNTYREMAGLKPLSSEATVFRTAAGGKFLNTHKVLSDSYYGLSSNLLLNFCDIESYCNYFYFLVRPAA